jgi:hypothetical protein
MAMDLIPNESVAYYIFDRGYIDYENYRTRFVLRNQS